MSGSDLFSGASPRVYNMPSGEPFLTRLARGLLHELGDDLSKALILLPNRRAVRGLTEAFLKESDREALLLPLMRPLADIDPDEPPFEPGELAHTIRPSIEPARRRFMMAALLRQRDKHLAELTPDPAAALALADPLLALMDDVAAEELTPDNFKELDEIIDFTARHYADAVIFFQMLTQIWPAILDDEQAMDPMARRVAMINALAEEWISRPPDHPVIVAGSTGAVKATANLMKVVSRLPKGLVLLPGLDTQLDDEVWTRILAPTDDSLQHPQAMLARLLRIIGCPRAEVKPWPGVERKGGLEARRRLLTEALLPADDTASWLERIGKLSDNLAPIYGKDPIEVALDGLRLIEADTPEDEAQSIAIALRETLTEPDKTAALVTPDAVLARRVQTHLRRWNIAVDSSAGTPLAEEPLAVLVTYLLDLAGDIHDPVSLSALIKSPLTYLGRERDDVMSAWALMERDRVLRGPRLQSREDLHHRLIRAKVDPAPAMALWDDFTVALEPLTTLDEARAANWVEALVRSLETVTQRPGGDPTDIWRGETALALAAILRELHTHAGPLGEMDRASFSRLLTDMMRQKLLRPRFGTHPRLQILGPLEARLLEADRVILAGLNEGMWPASPSQDLFLSRGARKAIGLGLPERRYGLSAHDFAQLAASPDVILSRARRDDSAPTVASRWLWRLQTLIEGALGKNKLKDTLIHKTPYLYWSDRLNSVDAQEVSSIDAPAPKPKSEDRWWFGRGLSVTQMKVLIRDPYSIYARKILDLPALPPLDRPVGPAEFGSALHSGLEAYFRTHTPGDPVDEKALTEAMREGMVKAGMPGDMLAEEGTRLERAASFIATWQAAREQNGWYPVLIEARGEAELPTSGEPFGLLAYADRIDEKGGAYAILDYKTGAPPGKKEVQAGFDLQMPLQGYILRDGLFSEHGGTDLSGKPEDFVYVRVRGGRDPGEVKSLLAPQRGTEDWDASEFIEMAVKGAGELVDWFDKPENPYLSQPRRKFTHDYSDYDHLARRKEWARLAGEGE